MVLHGYYPNSREIETGGTRIPGQPGLRSKTMSKNKKEKAISCTSIILNMPYTQFHSPQRRVLELVAHAAM